MSHCISYIVVDTKDEIQSAALDFALYNSDLQENPSGGYHNKLEILDDVVYPDYETACVRAKALAEARRAYQDFAIPFYSVLSAKPTKPVEKLIQRLEKLKADQIHYEESHMVNQLAAKLITCKHCESKLAKAFLKSNRCPVCWRDLRSPSVLKRLQKYDTDIQTIQGQLADLKKKQAKKGPVNWLVKVEVHC